MSDAQTLTRRNGHALGWIATLFGATIIACHIESGDDRWAAAAWAFALAVPGSPASWGVIVLCAGLLLLHGTFRNNHSTRIWGARIGFLWFCSLMAASIIAFANDLSLLDDHLVNPLSIIAWGCFATMYRLQIKDERAIPQT